MRLSALNLEALAAALWSALAGGALAILLGRWGPWPTRMPIGKGALAIVRPIRRAALAFGSTIERLDGTLRQWPAARALPLGAGHPPRRGNAGEVTAIVADTYVPAAD